MESKNDRRKSPVYITETEESYIGYPYTPAGIVDKSPVILSKSEWRKIIFKGDKVVDLH